jgi:hypothetical protein
MTQLTALELQALESESIVRSDYPADIDAQQAEHDSQRESEREYRQYITRYHAAHTASWRTGENSFTVATLLHPASAGANNVYRIGRIVRVENDKGESVWRKRKSYANMQIMTSESGEITRARFLSGDGRILNGQLFEDKKRASGIVAKAYGLGFTDAYAAMVSSAKANNAPVAEESDGWDDISL